jgi:hypothetical protein
LEANAQSSISKANAPAYAAFLKTSPTDRKMVIESIVVLDAAPTISALDDELKKEVFWAGQYRRLDGSRI